MQRYISNNRIGENIRRIREKRDLSAVDVVARLGSEYEFVIDRTNYSKIEHGERGVSLVLATKLICLLNSSYEELVLGNFKD